jgi:uncharacterized protein YbjT (DUF2867 family)
VIVVTGSTGTIGSELVRLLAAAGADTRAISPVVERLLVRPPRTIADFVRDYAAAFS